MLKIKGLRVQNQGFCVKKLPKEEEMSNWTHREVTFQVLESTGDERQYSIYNKYF